MLNVVIVIPAYNEERRIAETVRLWLAELKSLSFRIVVVNDGSKDTTSKVLHELARAEKRLVVIDQANQGHSAAITAGYHFAISLKPEFIFQADADTPVAPSHFWKLWSRREETPFVIGVRTHRKDSFHRKIMSAGARFSVYLLFQANLHDPNVPFRLMQTSLVEAMLPLVPNGIFAANLFISCLAVRNAHAVEVPVEAVHRESVTKSLNDWRWLLVSWRCFREFVRIRFSGRLTLHWNEPDLAPVVPVRAEEGRRAG